MNRDKLFEIVNKYIPDMKSECCEPEKPMDLWMDLCEWLETDVEGM